MVRLYSRYLPSLSHSTLTVTHKPSAVKTIVTTAWSLSGVLLVSAFVILPIETDIVPVDQLTFEIRLNHFLLNTSFPYTLDSPRSRRFSGLLCSR